MHSWQANIEVFFLSPMEAAYNSMNADHATEYTPFEPGWYWWSCCAGCLPDSEPVGPFESESEALKNAMELE